MGCLARATSCGVNRGREPDHQFDVSFEGNHKLTPTRSKRSSSSRRASSTPRPKCRATSSAIIELYRRSGRFAATVTPNDHPIGRQNRIDLVFEINEGPTTGIRSIVFMGNKVFDDGRTARRDRDARDALGVALPVEQRQTTTPTG